MSHATTTVIGARLAVDDAAAFQRQAARHGVSTSRALAALVSTSLAVERAKARPRRRAGRRASSRQAVGRKSQVRAAEGALR
jgi:hypothetical protein